MFLQPAHEGTPHRGVESRIFPVRANADDGIRWIVVDVENRRESEMEAERTTLDGRDPPLFIRHRRVARGTDSHLRRKHRRAAEVDGVRQEIAAARAIARSELDIGADE